MAWGRWGRFIVAFGGLGDQALTDGFGGDADAHDLAIDQGADFLDVGLEGAFADAGDLAAYATEVFGFAASGDGTAKTGSLSGDTTYSRHKQLLLLPCKDQ